MKINVLCFLSLFISGTTLAQDLEKRLDSLLGGHVKNGEIHGCLAYVYQNDKDLIFNTYGYMDIENSRPMEKNAIFRIASLTKLITAVAALNLYEEGKFLLDDPVKKYIPEFGNLRVISPECENEDKLVTLPLERDVTIRDLFRHTAGLGYGGNDIIGRLYTREKAELNPNFTLNQFVMSITSVPLKYQPGSKWEYSYANDVLGYLIEVISGKPLDIYMDEVIFRPLGMKNTGFYVPEDKLYRLCNQYTYNENKLFLLEKAETSRFAKKPTLISGGGGGVSTADDYSTFCKMILNYGEYNGVRILERETVELLISNQIGEITERGFPVSGFGLGVGVNPGKNNGATDFIFWAGAPYNNTYMVDFNKGLIAILLIQNSPWGHLDLMGKFEKIVIEETNE